jgi:hypothetical protein
MKLKYVKCEEQVEAKETAPQPARMTTDVKCEERIEAKETAEHPARYTIDGVH